MSNYRISKYLKVAIITLLVIIAVLFYFLAVPKLINIDKYRPLIEERFEKRTGLPLKIAKLDSSMIFMGIKVSFTEGRVKHSDGRNFISADRGTVEIPFSGFLKKQIIIRKIRVNNFDANITRFKSGQTDIQQILLAKRKKGELETKLIDTNIRINNYKLLIKDQYVQPESKFLLTGKNVKISDFDPLKYIKLDVNGQIISVNKPNTEFNINYASKLPLKINNILANEPVLTGQIKDLYPEMFKSYIGKQFYLMNSIRFHDLKFNISMKKSKIIPRAIYAEILLKSKTGAENTGKILVKGIVQNDQLNVKELSLKGKDIDLFLTGIINNFTSKNAVLNLNLAVKKLKLNKLLPILPDNFKLPDNSIVEFRKYAVDGDLNADISIKGKVQKPDFYGSIDFKNLFLSYENFTDFIRNTSGRLVFDGRKVIFTDITGFIDKSRININGYSDFDGNINIKTAFSGLNLGLIHNFIVKNPDFEKINIKLKDINHLSGFASGILGFTGAAANLKTDGNIILSDVYIAFKGIVKPLEKLQGKIRFVQGNIFFEKIQGIIANSLFKADGGLVNNVIKASITSDRVNLSNFYNILRQSPALKNLKEQLKDISNLSGYARVKINLFGQIGENILQNAEVNIISTNISTKRLGFPINILSGKIFATANKIWVQSVKANILGGQAEINGQISGLNTGKIYPEIKIVSRNLDVRVINELKKTPFISKEIKNYLNEFSDFKGYLTLRATILPDKYFIDAKFNRVSAVYKPQNIRLGIRTGTLSITPDIINIKSLHSRISKSSFFINGQVENYVTKPNFNLTGSIVVNSEDIDKYINPYLDEPIKTEGKIPVNTTIQGNLSNLCILAEMTLEKGVNITLPKDISLPNDKVRTFNLAAHGNINHINIETFDIILDHIQRILHVSGIIEGILTSDIAFTNLQVINPDPMDIRLLNLFIEPDTDEPFFSEGTVKADLFLNGAAYSPEITGNIELNNNVIPSKNTKINHAIVEFTDNTLLLSESSINIAGSDLQVKGTADKTFNLPLNVRDVEITSSSLNMDKVQKAIIKQEENEPIAFETLPITVQSGQIKANEFIISNFITNNVTSSFTITPDWLLTIPDLYLEAADGKASGKIIHNIKSTETTGTMSVEGMSANAAATIFLNIPNEVYGTLKGNVQFDTKGKTKDELISNASGITTFSIKDGRLTRLGSLEYLLLAANTVTVGLAGINLNSILNLIVPQRTGYFEELDGKLTAEKGILSTDNVASKGKNLSLLLSGKINMLTNDSELTILGRVSKKVSGLLGPLGSLSINTFVEYLPGLGFIPGAGGKGLIEMIPLISRIPILGLGQKKFRRFVVEIQGDLYDPKSVKSFRWLD
ncbi:MAG: AsmA-like C-terminal region-containing protein [Candidatus Gastranaerophilales bacterium]|nr:AsmA-like C-terminal region-containing protein [Candidatus Gastranaerophilales bacterium]